MLPIGQQLWLKQLMSYKEFPPLQAPASYNLDGILEQVKKANASAVTRATSGDLRAMRLATSCATR